MDHHVARLQASLRALGDSKTVIAGIAIVIALVIALIAFEAGVLLGYHEARSSYQWGENYAHNFGGPSEGFFFVRTNGPLPDGHGAFGQIASITPPTFILVDRNKPEERVRIGSDTLIKRLNTDVDASALMPGMRVVILGNPNGAGEIEAKLIRIMPSPQSASGTHP